MKRVYIYINYKNIVVLKEYLDIIKGALEENGFTCNYVSSLKGIPRNSLFVFPMGTDAFKFYLKGYHNFILWQQGATADESYMRNRSRLRHCVINVMDIFAMRKAKFILYVSEYMRSHYEKLAHCKFENKSYIMPCFNEEFDPEVFKYKCYSNKVFTYVGSLDLWQCFDKIVDLYLEIEKKNPQAYFKVLTFQVEEAIEILRKRGIKNFSVKQVEKDDVKRELLECTYGFVLREDNIVNRVATPTKISSYLAAGVIPIFSDCLVDFYNATKDYSCVLPVCEGDAGYRDVFAYINEKIEKNVIQEEIREIFATYYCKSSHVQQLKRELSMLKGFD